MFIFNLKMNFLSFEMSKMEFLTNPGNGIFCRALAGLKPLAGGPKISSAARRRFIKSRKNK